MPFIKEKPQPSNKYLAMDATDLFTTFMVEIGQYTWNEDKNTHELTGPLIESKKLTEKYRDWKKKKNL